MVDQCKHCTARGDWDKCISLDCFVHDSWYVNAATAAAFKAGMLAAADLVKPDYVTNDYEAGKEGASTIIREELGE